MDMSYKNKKETNDRSCTISNYTETAIIGMRVKSQLLFVFGLPPAPWHFHDIFVTLDQMTSGWHQSNT